MPRFHKSISSDALNIFKLNEILAASNLEPAALSVVTRKLEDVLDAKNGAIKDLHV